MWSQTGGSELATTHGDQGFGDLLVVVGDLLASAKDASLGVPFTRFMGEQLDPDNKLLFDLLSATRAMLDADPQERLLEALRRGFDQTQNRALRIHGISGAIRQSNRANPLDHGLLVAEDVGLIADRVGSYLLDGEHGLEKFYQLVANRK